MGSGPDAVLSVLAVLSNPVESDESKRHAAVWLKNWRTSPASWGSAIVLIDPQLPLGDNDRCFIASVLRECSRSMDLHPSLILGFLEPVALSLLAALCRGALAVAHELAATCATLAIRCHAWDVRDLIADLAAAFQRQAPVIQTWVQEQQQQQQQQWQQQGDIDADAAQRSHTIPANYAPLAAMLWTLRFIASEARSNKLVRGSMFEFI